MAVTPIVNDPGWTSEDYAHHVCALCGQPANAKVAEEIAYDDPFAPRHRLSAYLCASHFQQIMGVGAVAYVEGYRSRLLKLLDRG